MRKIKVLHITNGADVGGISNVILNYFRNIDREKFQFDFVIPPSEIGPNGKELEKLGGHFYILPKKSEDLKGFVRGLRKLIKQNHYDVVHAHHHDTSYVSLFVAMSCGVKCRVAQSHSYMVEGQSFKTRFRRAVAVLLNDLSANLRFACTNEAADYLFGKRLKHLFPVTILPNGAEPDNFQFSEQARNEAREELGIRRSTLVYGIVARVSAEKNHKFLIDILPEILKKEEDSKLLIVGGGPLREELESYAREKNLKDNIIFAGRRPDLLNMLCAMDVFTLPSFYEGSPVSAVEAFATGLPIVLSSRITNDLHVLKNVSYVGIEENDRERWASTIIEQASKGRNKEAISLVNKYGFNVKDIANLLADSYLSKLKII